MTRYISFIFFLTVTALSGVCAQRFVTFDNPGNGNLLPLITDGKPVSIYVDEKVDSAAIIASDNLCRDFGLVCGTPADKCTDGSIIITTVGSPVAEKLIKTRLIDGKDIKGKHEKFIIKDIDGKIIIIGSDRRGTVYGIYELSEQLGVSPWYWWADVPVTHRDNAWFTSGTYTDGEPAVRYRGIFLNDEAPCLTGWVENHYGQSFGDHRFYADVFELILRLRGNFMWPAMWCWTFYGDDPMNSATADRMGVIMGTSHHEPMARNHQEWTRNRDKYGKWSYTTNQEVIDNFFREGIRRMKDTEDIVTIGMRGDGDEAMEEGTNVALMEKIVRNQRKIIEQETGRKAKETPQVWALYKEVLDYYDAGMRVPDDVIMLLCDDNWGNVRRLPDAQERKHPGGWGMYYHVDYVGAPRNTKWLNVTPIQNMWEQLSLTYDYGVDKLWILNVGDLKPMEYPITLFMDMAWNPKRHTADDILDHTERFCALSFGEENAREASRLLNRYSKMAGRVTPEMLDKDTYDLKSGEWRMVSDEWARLEAEALRLFITLPAESHDAYRQLILFPIQAMSNLYEMYYAQAMNHDLHNRNNPQANMWADKVAACFKRDSELCRHYNKTMSNGKWDGMMTQKHIGYTSWNDDFKKDTMPVTYYENKGSDEQGGYIIDGSEPVTVIEAEHYFASDAPEGTRWQIYPDMGRTLSGVALTPYTASTGNAELTYKLKMPTDATKARITFITKSTLAFANPDGHCFKAYFNGCAPETININSNLNEHPDNIYTVFYPTVARRVIEKSVELPLPADRPDGHILLHIAPLDPGIVFEKIIIDTKGDYKPTYLNLPSSDATRMVHN